MACLQQADIDHNPELQKWDGSQHMSEHGESEQVPIDQQHPDAAFAYLLQR